MNEIKNVLCPVCSTELQECHAKSSLGLRGTLLEGKCVTHGVMKVRFKDGKLYSENGERPYQGLPKKKKEEEEAE